jgi:hypothetical protein
VCSRRGQCLIGNGHEHQVALIQGGMNRFRYACERVLRRKRERECKRDGAMLRAPIAALAQVSHCRVASRDCPVLDALCRPGQRAEHRDESHGDDQPRRVIAAVLANARG